MRSTRRGRSFRGRPRHACRRSSSPESLLRDEPNLVWDGQQFEVRVTDEAGKLVTAVHVSAIDAEPEA